MVPAVVFLAGAAAGATGLNPPVDPLGWPSLPVVPAMAIMVAAVAAVAAPPPVRSPSFGSRLCSGDGDGSTVGGP